jgi:pilus assembly protein CpaE
MPEISVVIVCTDSEQRAVLQVLVDNSSVAKTVHTCATFPEGFTDPVVRRIQAAAPDVVVVDIPGSNPQPALHALEVLHHQVPDSVLFAVGSMAQPQVIVGAMRAGAREFLERPVKTTDILEGLVRVSAGKRRSENTGNRGKVITIINAKGGSGATTLAVNLATALQDRQGSVALIDMAPLGHDALHLGLRPTFGTADAIRNLHRMDSSLLESLMTRHPGGLQLLAGPSAPAVDEPTPSEFARLFDILVGHFRYLVVDASSRVDATVRLISNLSEWVLLVANPDVTSLWSAGRIRQYLGELGSRDRVGLVLNRFRKITGFKESDAEAVAGAKLLWKLPNQYFAVADAIDRGVPLTQQAQSDLSKSIQGLAVKLTENDIEVKRTAWSLFKSV